MSQPRPRYVRFKREEAEASSRKPEMKNAETQDSHAFNVPKHSASDPLINMSQPRPRYVRLKRAEAETSSRKPEMKNAETQHNHTVNPQSTKKQNPNPNVNRGRPEQNQDACYPLSGKPFFSVIIARTHVEPSPRMYFPAHIYSQLPSARVPTVLNYCGKSWKLDYVGNDSRSRFHTGWKNFITDNDLKIGDACVFEMTEGSASNLEFRVQILRGDFPSELLDKADGAALNAPILID